jgi:hypothetical protein
MSTNKSLDRKTRHSSVASRLGYGRIARTQVPELRLMVEVRGHAYSFGCQGTATGHLLRLVPETTGQQRAHRDKEDPPRSGNMLCSPGCICADVGGQLASGIVWVVGTQWSQEGTQCGVG